MGLHPKAILAVMLLVLELLGRGYRVVLSTHHPLVLDVVWGLQRIRAAGKRGGPARVLEMFGMAEAQGLRGVAEAALEKDYRVTYFDLRDGRVATKSISDLDPGSSDEHGRLGRTERALGPDRRPGCPGGGLMSCKLLRKAKSCFARSSGSSSVTANGSGSSRWADTSS
jgi:hypothetical protein